jgi:hypothetical protein
MLTLNEMKANLARERQVAKDMIEHIKTCREAIKSSRAMQSSLRAEIRRETQINRVVKEDARAATKVARDAKRAERVAARIAKAEARLEALKQREFARAQKATKKSTKGVIWTAGQVAAMNAERGLA